MPKAKDTGSGKRKDNRGIVLNKGESQIAGGKYRYRYYDDKGNPHDITAWRLRPEDPTPAGHKPEKSLREKEKDIRQQLDDGVKVWSGNIALKDLVKQYLDEHKPFWAATTYSDRCGLYRKHIEGSAIGRKHVNKLIPEDIEKFYLQLCTSQTPIKQSSLTIIDSIVRPALQKAVRNRMIPENPAEGIYGEVALKLGQQQEQRHALEETELTALLLYIQAEYPAWYPLFYFLAWTGCRIGEALGLTWQNVDFDKKVIHITKTLEYTSVDGKHQFVWKEPKTKAGIREIPMLYDVKDILLGMRPDRDEKVVSIFDKEPTLKDLVFQGRFSHKPIQNRSVQDAITRIEAGYNKTHSIPLPHVTCHIFRHTFACWLIENISCGENATLVDNLKYAQDVLGQKDISTTMNIYAEIRNNKRKEKHDILRAVAGNR